jgi:hypothetical protein
MDSLITAAARALTSGDPLGALNRVALRTDAPALALRTSRWRSSAISFARSLSWEDIGLRSSVLPLAA